MPKHTFNIRTCVSGRLLQIILASAEHSLMELFQFANNPDLHGVDGGLLGRCAVWHVLDCDVFGYGGVGVVGAAGCDDDE